MRSLDGVMGFEPPAWRAVLAGAQPPPIQPEEFEPSQRGWQHEAASRVERAHRETLFPRMSDPAKALVRSHGGPGAGLALLTCPTCRLTKLDTFGHHRAACARAGVLGKRGYALESVVARICREAGGRVATNVLVRELDLVGVPAADGRRLEVVVDGLPLLQASSWPLTPLWSVPCAVTAQPGVELLMLTESRWLSPDGERSVGIQSWWGLEPDHVLLFLAWRSVADGLQKRLVSWALWRGPNPVAQCLMRKRAEWSWRLRWGSILSCAAARAVAASLLDLPRTSNGADGEVPHLHEVERDLHVAGRLE